MEKVVEFDTTELDGLAMCQMFTKGYFEGEVDEELTFEGDVNRAKEYVENQLKKQKLTHIEYEMSSHVSCCTEDQNHASHSNTEDERGKFKSAIISPYSPYSSLHSETRLEYLMRVPSLLQSAFLTHTI